MRVFLLLSALAAVISVPAAQAQRPAQAEHGKSKKADAPAVSVTFSTREREVLTEYYRSHTYAAKPLPPGIAKNLARGKPLPPGIAKTRMPTDLVGQLPAREGVEISIYGDRIVLLEASGLVLDILSDIF